MLARSFIADVHNIQPGAEELHIQVTASGKAACRHDPFTADVFNSQFKYCGGNIIPDEQGSATRVWSKEGRMVEYR